MIVPGILASNLLIILYKSYMVDSSFKLQMEIFQVTRYFPWLTVTTVPGIFLILELSRLLFCRYASKAARGRPYTTISGGPPQCHTFLTLPQFVFPMLSELGPHLSCDPILTVKILRIGKGFMKEVVFSSHCAHPLELPFVNSKEVHLR